jgi:2,5-diketo-D-gluconate reductase B
MSQVDSPVPRLGLGTWQLTGEPCRETVRTALEMGYGHVDTAELYDNEEAVGAGIEEAAVGRDEVYLATKVLHPWSVDGDPTRASIREDVTGCLDRLGVDAVDLLYVHWPSDYDFELVHATLAELRDEGRIDGVGVSNYEPRHLETALATDPEIVANQVELHPLLPRAELREFCADAGLDVVAYAPLAHGEVFDVPAIQAVADDRGVSVARLCLAWLRHLGVAAVPKATGEAHLRDNRASRDLELRDDDVARIEGIERRERFFDPDYAPDW